MPTLQFKNIQERMSSQNEEGDTQAIVAVARDMLDLLDNFDRAFQAVKPENDAQQAIEDDYKGVYKAVLETFERLGIKEVETVGIEFDYEIHQAVMQMPKEGFEEGIVCDEFAKGFIMGEMLIRPAMVGVAA